MLDFLDNSIEDKKLTQNHTRDNDLEKVIKTVTEMPPSSKLKKQDSFNSNSSHNNYNNIKIK